jgi:hypothetical protein
LIILSSSKIILFSQEQLNPFVLSPFIGEKLDRVEESYFNLFPGVTSFNEATFYLDVDSSLFINVRFYENNLLKDTLILSTRSQPYLKDRINEVILKDIKEGRVEELEFSTENTEKFEGSVYSFDNEQIKLIEEGFIRANEENKQEEYLQYLKFSDIKALSIGKSNTAVSIAFGVLGMVVGGLIGAALAPEPEPETIEDIVVLPAKSIVSLIPGILIGGVSGYLIGSAIKVPVEYDPLDSETKRIINENTLLPSGL